MEITRKRIKVDLDQATGHSFNTIGELREWINHETFLNEDTIDIESYEDTDEVEIEVYRWIMESDEAFAKRFNEEQERLAVKAVQDKAKRHADYIRLREEFEQANREENG